MTGVLAAATGELDAASKAVVTASNAGSSLGNTLDRLQAAAEVAASAQLRSAPALAHSSRSGPWSQQIQSGVMEQMDRVVPGVAEAFSGMDASLVSDSRLVTAQHVTVSANRRNNEAAGVVTAATEEADDQEASDGAFLRDPTLLSR